MAEDIARPKLVQIAELFERHSVEFLVIGGQAAVLHGSPLPTFDVDVCYRRTVINLEHLAKALQEIHWQKHFKKSIPHCAVHLPTSRSASMLGV